MVTVVQYMTLVRQNGSYYYEQRVIYHYQLAYDTSEDYDKHHMLNWGL